MTDDRTVDTLILLMQYTGETFARDSVDLQGLVLASGVLFLDRVIGARPDVAFKIG